MYDVNTEISDKKPKSKTYSSSPSHLKKTEKVSSLDDDDLLIKLKKYTTSFYERYSTYIDQAREHMRFLYVDQWDEEVRGEREKNDIPTLQFNHILPNLDGVLGQLKKNSPQLIVSSINDSDDRQSIDWRTDLLRQIQCASKADIAYQTALKNQMICGWGFCRVSIDYEGDDTFKQCLRISSDPDYQVAFWDLTAPDLTKSEGDFCGVHQRMRRDDFHLMYPECPNPVSSSSVYDSFNWGNKDDVVVCDIYYKDYFKKTLAKLSDGREMPYKEAKAIIKQSEDMMEDVFAQIDVGEELVALLQEKIPTIEIAEKRDVMAYTIKHVRFVENQVLAKTDWPGKLLPVIFFPGDSAMVDGELMPVSWINELQDPQRLHNYIMSEMARGMLSSTKSKVMGTDLMIQGHEQKWRQINKVQGMLTANPDPRVPGAMPQFIDPPPFNQALLALQNLTTAEMSTISGRFEESRGQESNAISGVAIKQRISAANNVVNVFFDNNLKGIEQTGRVMMDLVPHVHPGEQDVVVRSEDGVQKKIKVNKKSGVLKVPRGSFDMNMMMNGMEEQIENDVTDENYEVMVKAVGSLDSQKMESMQLWLDFMRLNPAAFPLLSDIVAKESGAENSKLASERLKSLLPPDIRAKEEGMPPPPPQPNPALQLEEKKLALYNKEIMTKQAQIEQDRKKDEIDSMIQMEQLKMKKEDLEFKKRKAIEDLKMVRLKTGAEVTKAHAQVHKTMRG